MPAVTPSFVMDLESRMRRISETDYLRITQKLYWDKLMKVIPSGSRREIITWILNTAHLEDQGQGGNIAFEDMVMLETEFTAKTAGKGLRLRRQQFEDLDGNGVPLATEWSAQMGAQHAYWPQRQAIQLLRDGETGLAYDAKAFFATDHPNNPYDAGAGTYKNLYTGADAAPIDESVTLDVAIANLGKVYAAIAAMKMPNGKDPRFLRPAAILCAPKLFPRAMLCTNAKYIAMAASTGGGSADIEGLITRLGYGMPTQADELSDFESGTTYFVIAEQLASSQLGGLVYVDREPFSIRYYTGRGGGTGVDAVLDRGDVLEWHTSGRNVAGYGHPFLIFTVKAA
jgi:hypothetical protein